MNKKHDSLIHRVIHFSWVTVPVAWIAAVLTGAWAVAPLAMAAFVVASEVF